MPFFDLRIRWVESSDFGPKSKRLGPSDSQIRFDPVGFCKIGLHKQAYLFRSQNKNQKLGIRSQNKQPKAISYGTALRTEKKKIRAAKSIINLMDPNLVIFSAKLFNVHFRDGLQPEMGPHVRSTSANPRSKLASGFGFPHIVGRNNR